MKKIFILVLGFYAMNTFAQKTIHLNKYLRSNIGTITLWDSETTRIFGITDALAAQPEIPAPTIICNEGDTVIINALSISQSDHHTIHLHGLDVDTRNDGDPMTSFFLQHLQDTTYTFVAKHAGTYVYHCHVGDVVHVQMGMYGLIIIRAKDGVKTAWTNGPAFDKDYGWLTSEIDKSWHDTIPQHDPITDKLIIPKYVPDYFLVNGKSHQQIWADTLIQINATVNRPTYLRLCNIGFSDNQVIFPKGLNATIIASDGRPLPGKIRTDTVVVSPGERYGVMMVPDKLLSDSITVNFLSLNTNVIQGTEKVPVNITKSSTIKVNSGKEPSILIFPNPTNDQISIKTNENITDVTIQNMLGQIIYESHLDIQDSNAVISLHGIKSGIYIINVQTVNSTLVSKIIFQEN